MTLKDLNPADRKRYAKSGQSEDDLVTLDCASCHRLEAGSHDVTSSAGVRLAGDYMLPVQFDTQCTACHHLTIDGATKPVSSASTGTTVPHGIQGDDLSKALTQIIAAKLLESAGEDLRKIPLSAAAKEPLEKWRLPNRQPSTDAQASTIGEYLQQETKAATERLKLQCAECHQMKSTGETLEVQPVDMHPAWFTHAKFDHAAHRAVSCEACHGGAFPAELPKEPTTLKALDSEVFIPGKQLCLNCHSPATGEGSTAKGGARFDCVECHRYHNGDDPWHGKGSEARGAKSRLPIEDFINGETWKSKSTN
jgi:cytochrome c7-like protein